MGGAELAARRLRVGSEHGHLIILVLQKIPRRARHDGTDAVEEIVGHTRSSLTREPRNHVGMCISPARELSL